MSCIVPFDLGCQVDELFDLDGIKQANERIAAWLVELPTWSLDQEVAQRQQHVSSIAVGLLGLVLVVAVTRYWAAGLTSGDAGAAITALGRSVAAGAGLLLYPDVFGYAIELTNRLTAAILVGSGQSFTNLMRQVLALEGPGLVAVIVAAVLFYLLVFVKLIIAQLLAVLYVLMPLAIAVSPLKEAAGAVRACCNALAAICASSVTLAVCLSIVGFLAPGLAKTADGVHIPMISGLSLCCGLILMVKMVGLIFRQASLNTAAPNLPRTAMAAASTAAQFALASRVGRAGAAAKAAAQPGAVRQPAPAPSLPPALEGRPPLRAIAERLDRPAGLATPQGPPALEPPRSAKRAAGSPAPPPSPPWRGRVFAAGTPSPASASAPVSAKPAAYTLEAGPIGRHGGEHLLREHRHPESGRLTQWYSASPVARQQGIERVIAQFDRGSDVPKLWHEHADGRTIRAQPVSPLGRPVTAAPARPDLPQPPQPPLPDPFSGPPRAGS